MPKIFSFLYFSCISSSVDCKCVAVASVTFPIMFPYIYEQYTNLLNTFLKYSLVLLQEEYQLQQHSVFQRESGPNLTKVGKRSLGTASSGAEPKEILSNQLIF